MKRKLYIATKNVTTMFLSNKTDMDLEKEARGFLSEEETVTIPKTLTINEVTCRRDIPDDWRGFALLWGTDNEITASDFLSQEEDPEYIQYLQLKKKYEE